MKLRRSVFVVLAVGSAYVAFVGCGDEETPSSQTTDAGQESSTVDTYKPPVDAALDSRSPEYTGSACKAPADCYGDIDAAALHGGAAVCIEKVTNGYCTHECQTDDDCCAVPGECRTGLKQVCASFENTDKKYCFLSCEEADIASATDAGASDAGVLDGGFDGNQYCVKNTSAEFGCRSTGGGSNNRKACLPTGIGDGGAGDGGSGKKDSGADAGDAGDGGDAG